MNWLLALRVARAASTPRNRRRLRAVLLVGGSLVVGGISTFGLVLASAVSAQATRGPTQAVAAGTGIPPVVFTAYLAAEANAHTIASDCAVDWPVVAAIWRVESVHATFGGATVDAAGQVTPPIYGPALDGSTPGTQVVADTDEGLFDRDPVWDRAVGPAQFLPTSWNRHGRDGNNDGTADPQNVFDAALSTVAYLCQRTPGDFTDPDHLRAALLGYNRSTAYVATVSEWIAFYRAFTIGSRTVTAEGYYAFPLPTDSVTLAQIRRTHHDYPAWDAVIPEGTPVFAAHPGTVTAVHVNCAIPLQCRCGWGLTIAGLDGYSYGYCHALERPHLSVGDTVGVGEWIMASGDTGNSSVPHLHFSIRTSAGALLCPQPLLEAWWQGVGLTPAAAPRSGCTH